MIKLTITCCTVLLISLQLAGCQSQTQNMNSEADAVNSAVVTSAPVAAEQQENEKVEDDDDQTIQSEENAPTPSSEALPVKKYRMKDNYRFEAIDESYPSKVVLLTFDDGPKDETVLSSMLATLDKHQAKAIFFVNGFRVKQNPDLLKLIHDAGQTIGNHSWDHINLKNENNTVIEQQIGDVQTAVESITGVKPLFFRPPYGSGGEAVKSIAKNHGMLYMTWSNGSLDWDQSARNKPEVVIQNVMEQLHPGANILMHELQWTADALDELLTKLEGEGYSFIDPASIEVEATR